MERAQSRSEGGQVAASFGLRRIEQTLPGDMRAPLDGIADGRSQRLEGRYVRLRLVGRPRVAREQGHDGPSVNVLAKPWRRRGQAEGGDEGELGRSRLHDCRVECEHIVRLLEAPGDRAPHDLGPDGVERKVESRDDPEVTAPAAEAQKRSAFSLSLARTTRPSAVTTSMARTLSDVQPKRRVR